VNEDGSQEAAMLAANELAVFLNASVVAIGYCHRENSKRTKVQAVSGVSEVDPGGKHAGLLRSVLNESLIRDSVTTLPRIDTSDRSLKLAHQQLLEKYPHHRLVSAPLRTTGGKVIGGWLCVLPNDARKHERLCRFAAVTSGYLADALDANRRASVGAVSRLVTQFKKMVGGQTGKVVMAAMLLASLIMMIPVPHRVACDCELIPVVRRFAVAPHDGILLETFVRPGDIVSAGQVIARMDDQELMLERYDLLAKRETAIKKRDVSRSNRDASATQIAEMDLEQLETQIELVEFKRNNLEIKSIVAGIVLQGDLEDAQGAPVRIGDVLAEVAPLQTLRLELNVNESDIAYVELEQTASIVLDGNPLDLLTGQIERIRPASENRNNKNVFVSEIAIDNQNALLRPGMQGTAKIAAGDRSLGWILFHKPFERVYKIFR
jgi:hypothetical protein